MKARRSDALSDDPMPDPLPILKALAAAALTAAAVLLLCAWPWRAQHPVRTAVGGVAVGALLATAVVLSAAPRKSHAEQEVSSVHYPAGWNIVAAPSATELRGSCLSSCR